MNAGAGPDRMTRLAKVEDVDAGYVQAFDIGGRSILLVCGEKGARVVYNICPHAGSPLEGGRVSGHRFRCPRHGYIFDLESGISSRGASEGFGPLQFGELAVVDGYYVVPAAGERDTNGG